VAYVHADNRVNGDPACSSNTTLTRYLRERLNFSGIVMSDWLATHSTAESLNAGLDLEMPAGLFYNGDAVKVAIDLGRVSQATVDEHVLRTLSTMFAFNVFDAPTTGQLSANVTSFEHNSVARRIAAQSTVMLKNEGAALPLYTEAGSCDNVVRSLAVVGTGAHDAPMVTGGGSGFVKGNRVLTVLDVLRVRAGLPPANISYSTDTASAVVSAAEADAAIVVVGTSSTEGLDRSSLSLRAEDVALIRAVGAVNKRTVVVVSCPGAILTDWSDSASAILVHFLAGQESGGAIVDILFGDTNPSARLPLTFPNMENEQEFTPEQYPGVRDGLHRVSTYSEKLAIGYRWYHTHRVAPAFAFGTSVCLGAAAFAPLGCTVRFFIRHLELCLRCDSMQGTA
jgi:beta-glucosidase